MAGLLIGAGAKIDLAYMNNREFRFDADVRSAKRIVLAANRLKVVTQTLARPTYIEDVSFVCTDEQAEGTLPQWHKWTKAPSSSIEPTGYIRDDTVDSMGRDAGNVVAWWALNEDLIWTREEAVAENIRQAFVVLGRPVNLGESDPPAALAP